MSNNNQNLANQQNSGTISTMDNAPVYVPKITLTGSDGGALQPASPSKTNVEAAPEQNSRLGLIYSIVGFAFGILALVSIIILGLFSIPLSVVGFGALIPYGIGIVLSIIGIVLSAMGRNAGDTTGLAKAGLVMSIIPLVVLAALITLTILGIAACTAAFSTCTSAASQAALLLL